MAYKRSSITKAVGKISEGLLSTAVDLVLVSIFYSFEVASAGYGGARKAGIRTHEDISGLNYQTIKRAFTRLRRKGLIQSTKEKLLLPKITAEGKKRLEAILPKYDERRVWDQRIYLVTYDLPIRRNYDRDRLREFLKKIGCAMLQYSVWLTPYNPTKLIEEFTEERNLEGLILVSSLGKDGTIGDKELSELMEEVYHLSELNRRYGGLLIEAKQSNFSKEKVVFSFLSILQDDPQLPFELLPEDWLGEQAYRLFQKLTK